MERDRSREPVAGWIRVRLRVRGWRKFCVIKDVQFTQSDSHRGELSVLSGIRFVDA